MAKKTRLESIQDKLEVLLPLEDVCKISSSVADRVGTHDGYRRVAHRATQRAVESWLTKQYAELHPESRALTSTDRAEIRRAACELAGVPMGYLTGAQTAKIGKAARRYQALFGQARAQGCVKAAVSLLLQHRDGRTGLALLWLAGDRSHELAMALRTMAAA